MKHLSTLRRLGAGLALAVALAACASAPPDHFYTLMGEDPAPPPASSTPLYIEMLPVAVPAQVRRNQLVVQGADGKVELLEQHRWIGPLADEIGNALSAGVTSALGAVDVYRTPHPADAPLYRISTSVQRFESVAGSHALIVAVWSVRKAGSEAVLTCRSALREDVGPGYEALVAGHRAALGKLAAAIAAAVRAQAAGRPASC